MGLPNWLHWTAWFLKTFTFMMISVILIVICVTVPWYPGTDVTVFTFSDPSLLLVYLIVFVAASICYMFLISVLFSKGTLLHNVVFCLLAYLTHVFLINMANMSSCFSDRASWIDYILVTNLMHQLFIHKIIFSSTCFEPQVLIFRRIQLYTCSICYCHSLWEFLVACRYTA